MIVLRKLVVAQRRAILQSDEAYKTKMVFLFVSFFLFFYFYGEKEHGYADGRKTKDGSRICAG